MKWEIPEPNYTAYVPEIRTIPIGTIYKNESRDSLFRNSKYFRATWLVHLCILYLWYFLLERVCKDFRVCETWSTPVHSRKLILLHGIKAVTNFKLISQTENDSQALYLISDESLLKIRILSTIKKTFHSHSYSLTNACWFYC